MKSCSFAVAFGLLALMSEAPAIAAPPDAAKVEVQPWSQHRTYRLFAAPERVSTIALEPGETLLSAAAGDTARWVIGDMASGSGAGRRTLVLVKPKATGLGTDLLIATDRRVYRIELSSRGVSAPTGLAWTYPADGLVALARKASAAPDPALAVESLDFGYRISGDNPPWRPLRAFDDGRQVYIEFPASISSGEAPPLFVRGGGGRSELVNYRMRGRFYVVDRLFGSAELRLGTKRQKVVRIDRAAPSSRRRRGRGS